MNQISWENYIGMFAKGEFMPLKDAQGNPITKDDPILTAWDMHPVIMNMAVLIREETDSKFIITPNGGFAYCGHSKKSLHYGVAPGDPRQTQIIHKGRAIDFVLKHRGRAPRINHWPWLSGTLAIWKLLNPDYGLGIYPFGWRARWHIDYRGDLEDRKPAIWWTDDRNPAKVITRAYPFFDFALLLHELFDYIHVNRLKPDIPGEPMPGIGPSGESG